MCGGFFIDATPRWQKIGCICMLSHRPLFFPFFSSFFSPTSSGHSLEIQAIPRNSMLF